MVEATRTKEGIRLIKDMMVERPRVHHLPGRERLARSESMGERDARGPEEYGPEDHSGEAQTLEISVGSPGREQLIERHRSVGVTAADKQLLAAGRLALAVVVAGRARCVELDLRLVPGR